MREGERKTGNSKGGKEGGREGVREECRKEEALTCALFHHSTGCP